MATKTKRPPPKPTGKQAAIKTAGCRYVTTGQIPVAGIDPSPFQPRLAICEADLAPLAAAMQTAGFLDAVWVRELANSQPGVDGRFELLDGERRWRAAQLAGLATIRCDVFQASDAQARQMALLSVVHREDLSAIERATAFDCMLRAGDYPDQKALAVAMGVEQSTVSNLLRLLKLPEGWRQRIISREISERHARAVLPWLKYPTIMAAFDEYFTQNLDQSENRRELPSVVEWEEENVPNIVREATRSMDGMHGDRMYYHPRYGRVSIFDPTPFEEKQLKIIKLPRGNEAGDEHLATNVELWEELQAKHLEAGSREQGAGSREEDEPDAGGPAPAEEASAAATDTDGGHAGEEKSLATDETRIEHGSDDPPSGRGPSAAPASDFYRWKLAWTRKLVAEACARCEFTQLVKLLALGLARWGFEHEIEQTFDEALRGNMDFAKRKSLTANLLACQDYELEKVLAEVVSSWFWTQKGGPAGDVPAEDCELLAVFLDVDLAGEWQAGNVLAPRALLELYDDAGLRGLAKKWKLEVGADWNRKGLVGKLEQALADDKLNLGMPAEVAKAKR